MVEVVIKFCKPRRWHPALVGNPEKFASPKDNRPEIFDFVIERHIPSWRPVVLHHLLVCPVCGPLSIEHRQFLGFRKVFRAS